MKLVCESLAEFKDGAGSGIFKFTDKDKGEDVEGKVWRLLDFAKDYPIEVFSVKDLTKTGAGWDMNNTSGMFFNDEDGKDTAFVKLSKKRQDEVRDDVEKAIQKTDLSFPIIVSIDDKGKASNVLDGNHRVSKAISNKRKTLKGYAIPEEDILKKFKKK